MTPSTYTVTWSTPDGRFGFTDVEGCNDHGDAVETVTELIANPHDPRVPTDAQIDAIHPSTGIPAWRA